MEKERVLFTLRKARQAFLVEYACGVFLLGLIVIPILKGIQIQQSISYFVIGLSMFAFASAEMSRMFTSYKIKGNKLEIVHGIIKKTKKNVYFHPLGFVPDINTHQTRLQRLLNYGSIYVKSGNIKSFEIKDISNPHKIMDKIEQLVENNRGSMTQQEEAQV